MKLLTGSKQSLFTESFSKKFSGLLTPQIEKAMKLTFILLTAAFLQVSANGLSQNVTIILKDAPVEKVFKEIERQTGLGFLYTKKMLQEVPKVSINVKDVPVLDVLKECFKGQPLTYTIVDKTIVVKGKTGSEVNETEAIAQLSLYLEISGKVVDEKGQALPGVSVMNQNSGKGTATANDGGFVIQASAGDVVEFSFIGYEKKQIKIAADTKNLQVKLLLSDNKMETLIVTGYSSKKIREITGSVQKISGDELRQGVSSTNALAMLKGKTAGLYINETGGGSIANKGQVVMRGQASFGDAGNSNYGPLIVVDGVITTATSLQDIANPNDIENIIVLKDAASTAIYGSRAAQGVILVTTKRGIKGQVQVDLNLKYGQTKDNRLVRFMNTTELAAHINKYMEAQYNRTASIRAQFPTLQDFKNTTRPFTDADLNTYTNWDKVLYTDGHEKDINLALSGGSDKTRFYGAVDWYKEDGTLIDDKLDRKSIRLNIDQQINDKFSVSVNVNAIIDKYTSSTTDNQYYLFQPWVATTYANGQLADSVPSYRFRANGTPNKLWLDNPVSSHSYNTAINNIQSYLGTVSLKYKIRPWLSAQSTNTFRFLDNNNNSYRDPRTYRGRWDGSTSSPTWVNGELSVLDTRTEYSLTSNQLNFDKKFGQHHITALIGQEFGKIHSESVGASVYNTTYPGERNISAFQNFGSWLNVLTGTPEPPGGFLNAIPAPVDKASFSVFSEATYNYMQKYFASASFRRDASTNFGKLNRFGNFYSMGGGWLISNENFMHNLKPVSNMKLRASYGTSGREAGADYLNFTTYTDNVRYDNTNTFGSTIQRLGNDQITWETTHTFDAGLDLSLWKRIDITIDWYNRLSKNLIQTVPLPSYIGFASQTRNVGDITNKGVEMSISSQNIESRTFEWVTDFNISFNKNRLSKIYGDSLIDPWSRNFYRYEGEDMNVLKAVIFAGINPDNGRPLFERVMPDGKIAIVDSLPSVLTDGIRGFKKVGSATPKFFGGFTNTFRYKGISLSLLFNFVFGNTIMNNNVTNYYTPTTWASGFNMINPDNAIRAWQGPGDAKANYPDFYDPAFSQRGATNYRASLVYQDASYLRLRNVRLGYDLPKNMLAKAKIKSANIYLSMDNAFVIKSKELFAADPEGAKLGVTNGAFTGTGFTSAMPKRFVAGVNLSF